MRALPRLITCCSLAAATLVASGLAASAPFSGTIAGVFDNPVFVGTIYDPATMVTTPLDNSATAGASIAGLGTNSLSWGDTVPWSVTFTGATFSGVPADTPFVLGSLSFFNGTNGDPTSIIFGFDLLLSDGADIVPFSTGFSLAYTFNTGTAEQNADVFTVDGLALSYHVLEGGTGTADLYGRISADGVITLTSLTPTNDGGFVVPLPGTLALIGIGLVGWSFGRRRRSV